MEASMFVLDAVMAVAIRFRQSQSFDKHFVCHPEC